MSREALYATVLVGAFLLGAATAPAANFTVEAQPSARFSPANLTIQVGDSVTWVNTGGNHNVRADDDSFRCANGCDGQGGNGNPSTNAWTFTLTFDQPGVVGYRCEVHASVGMTGTITVEDAPQPEPGDLRFAQAARQVDEGAGEVVLTVQRVGGDDGAVTVAYATSDGSAEAGADYTSKSGTLSWADGNAANKTFTIPILDDGNAESDETINVMLSNPTGGAGLGAPSVATVTIVDDDDATPKPGTVRFSATGFDVGESGGSANVTVNRTGGTDGAVSVGYQTSDGSAEAGDDYLAAAGTLAWADGDGAAKSFAVDVLDDALEEGDETVNLSLSGPTGGANLGTSSATLTIHDDDQSGTVCVPDDETLCLGTGGRFQVRLEWQDFQGKAGSGKAFDIGKRDSGLIYFFNDANIELLVKVLNACNLTSFNTYWVFYAATTNVEFTLTVTDTEKGASKVYHNDLGVPAPPVLDTSAFATCP